MARPNYAPFPRMIAASALLVLSGCATAQPLGVAPAETETTASVPVAPWMGPLGPAAMTAGGRGGEIVRVTSLESDGPGTLRAALEADGPKIIVFEVGGVIDLDGNNLRVSSSRPRRHLALPLYVVAWLSPATTLSFSTCVFARAIWVKAYEAAET